MKLKKKALMRVTVEAIFLAIVAIILIFAAVKLIGAERIFGSYLSCRWEIFSQGIGPERLIGLGQIPSSCKADISRISIQNLTKGFKGSRKTIETFNLNYPDNQFSEIFDPTDEKSLVEFNLDKLIAKKTKSCVDKVNHGAMPIFENWWHLYGQDEKTAIGTVKEYLKAAVGAAKQSPVPRFCVICSEIRFNKDLIKSEGKYSLTGKDKNTITTLAEWMKKNPIPIVNMPYYEYAKLNKKASDLFASDSDYYYQIDKPMALVYMRVNIHQLVKWGQGASVAWETIAGWFPGLGVKGDYHEDNPPLEPEHSIVLMPYEDAGKECDFIIG
jgi:hypothetical protein